MGWLVRWLASLLVEWSVVGWYMVHSLVGCSVVAQSVGWLVGWLVGCIYTPWCVVRCGVAWCAHGVRDYACMCSHCKGLGGGSMESMFLFQRRSSAILATLISVARTPLEWFASTLLEQDL